MSLENKEVGYTSDLLVFVVGRSGSGKDSIMRNVASALKLEDIPVHVLQRHITRLPDKTEESLYVSEEEFLRKKSQKEYIISWYIYDNWYGCPQKPLKKALRRGEIVLVNASRSILYDAKEKYPRSKIVLIDAPDKVAEARIKIRGREDSNHLFERFTRMQKKIDMPFPDKIIQNEGDLDLAVQELRDYLRTIYQDSKIR
ncbi:MAG: hypothetical protein ACFFFH_19830 [Candidatus Thorarchaeota archaeon]